MCARELCVRIYIILKVGKIMKRIQTLLAVNVINCELVLSLAVDYPSKCCVSIELILCCFGEKGWLGWGWTFSPRSGHGDCSVTWIQRCSANGCWRETSVCFGSELVVSN